MDALSSLRDSAVEPAECQVNAVPWKSRPGERERVTVTIGIGADQPKHSHLDVEFIERARRELASVDSIPTLEGVRRMLSKDKSSWADYIIAERSDRL
jgi:hypothetical protein